jgi:hypothetical protein
VQVLKIFLSFLSIQFSDHIHEHPSMLLVLARYMMFHACAAKTDIFLVVPRHAENWNVPKMALLRQIFRPSRWVWEER